MAISVRFLRNHGARVRHPKGGRQLDRFVRPDGHLSVGEAAVALRTNEMKLYRLIVAGRLEVVMVNDEKRISLREVRRLKANRKALADRRAERGAA